MFLERFSIFKQKKPREFNYKPMHAKDEEVSENSTAESRIRASYGKSDVRSIREKMEDRRHFGGTYDHASAKKKLYFFAMVLIAIVIWIFLY